MHEGIRTKPAAQELPPQKGKKRLLGRRTLVSAPEQAGGAFLEKFRKYG